MSLLDLLLDEKKTLSLSLKAPSDLEEILDKLAKTTGVSRSSLMLRLILGAIDDQAPDGLPGTPHEDPNFILDLEDALLALKWHSDHGTLTLPVRSQISHKLALVLAELAA